MQNIYQNIFSHIGENFQSKTGSWEMDLGSQQLHWSNHQFLLYGYEPNEIPINDNYFIKLTTHASDIKRVSTIIDDAVKHHAGYYFKRRIVKKSGEIGFFETKASIVRSTAGKVCKIIGTTADISAKPVFGKYNLEDSRFFDAFYKDYHKIITRDIYNIVSDTDLAADLCQEVFIKAWNNMAAYELEKGKPYTWLTKIAKNHCLDFFKTSQFKYSKQTKPIKDSFDQRYTDNGFDADRLYVRQLLMQLPLDLREVIELLFIQGFTHLEVAGMKNLPLGTVKTKSRSAISKLRKLAEDYTD